MYTNKLAHLATVLLLATFLAAPLAAKQPQPEALYLSDSGTFADDTTRLYRVELDPSAGEARLALLPNGELPVNQGDAIAVTPDGERIYVFDKLETGQGIGLLGYYDVIDTTWHEIDLVRDTGTPIPGIVLADFSPAGELYAVGAIENTVYLVDPLTADAIPVGVVEEPDGTKVNLGPDIAFASDGSLFTWVVFPRGGTSPAPAPRGLYRMVLPASLPGPVVATHLGPAGLTSNVNLRGLEVLDAGDGELVASWGRSGFTGEIRYLDKTSGATLDTLALTLDGVAFEHVAGDLGAGPAPSRLTICHKGRNTLTLPRSAADAHLGNHASDTAGPCAP